VERCRREIAVIETELFAGHSDVEGLCLALSDWSAELRILQSEACQRGLDWPRRAEGSTEDREIGGGASAVA